MPIKIIKPKKKRIIKLRAKKPTRKIKTKQKKQKTKGFIPKTKNA